MLKRIKLSTRIIFLGVVIVLCFSLTYIWVISKMKSTMYDAKYNKTQELVESAWSVLDQYAAQVKAGERSKEDAAALAISAIRSMRYGENNYFWINDMTPRMVMHPVSTDLDGQDLSGKVDSYGKKFFVEMVETCRKSGEGFVKYSWPKPGSSEAVSKISYVKLQPEWNWIIGSGIYLDDVEQEISKVLRIVIASTLLIAIIGLGLSYMMGLSIARPIVRIVNGLDSGAEHVSAASNQLSSTSQEMAEGSSEQAASLEETSSALKEVAARSEETAHLTTDADILMNENIQKSGKTLKAMMDLTEKMTQIEADSGKIARIIKAIDELAFQTNLLALNAAIEAARAGEAGAGFAVVADEVRSLAVRSTTAAKDTQQLLDGIVRQVMDSGASIKSVNADFEGIIESATRMGEKTEAITRAAKELSGGIAQINDAVEQIEHVTQRNAANSEESAAAAEELNAQSQEMRRFVDILSGIIGGRIDQAPEASTGVHSTGHPDSASLLSESRISGRLRRRDSRSEEQLEDLRESVF